jgi:hypothetical protein
LTARDCRVYSSLHLDTGVEWIAGFTDVWEVDMNATANNHMLNLLLSQRAALSTFISTTSVLLIE